MKFTDGYWEMKPGYVPHRAAQTDDLSYDEKILTIYGTTMKINHRGDTTMSAVITVKLSSPMPNVIRVQSVHHKGAVVKSPEFDISCDPDTPVSITEDKAGEVVFTSGDLSAHIVKGADWNLRFMNGERDVTGSGWRAHGFVDTPDGRFYHEQLNLGVGEYVYGMGERFTSFVKNGQIVEMWNEDGGTSSEIAYKNIPFYLTNRGYGVLVNHPEKVSFEVASENVERVQFSVPGESLDYYVILGPTPKEVLERYTALTGRPALPPAWSFGLWLTTSFTTDYDEATVTSFIDGMAEREIPLHVFHFDCFWMRGFHWTDFEWDPEVFPNPKAMLERLKAKGLRICVWINPYIAQRSRLFDEGMENGYLLKHPDGSVWQWDRWQAGMGIVDFTNPDACDWYAGYLRDLIDMGVDTFKTDFGERIPTDVVYFDGSDPVKMHNYYTVLYNQLVFGVLEEKLGEGQATVFARSASVGGQKFPVHWGGDNSAKFESMAESLRGGMSLCLSGFGFWSHDIGGFESTAPADVYKRWCAFGLLSSHSRLHGSRSYRVPWLFDEEAVDVLRFYTQLKCRLMPYLFTNAVVAHEEGIPMMRAMFLEFPDDPAVDTLDRQYMLGDSLLVAPVLSSIGDVDYFLPTGRWTNFISGKVIEGNRWLRENHDFFSLPLMVKENTLLPVGANDQVPDYIYADDVTFHLFELANACIAKASVPDITGNVVLTASVSRDGDTITATFEGAADRCNLLLRGVMDIGGLVGGTATHSALGTLIAVADDTVSIQI